MSGLRRVLTWMANMGLTVKDDRPRVIDMTGREWGEPLNGLELSIREAPKEDPRQPAVLSVVLRNTGPERRRLTIPGWLFFYQIETTAPLSAYGRELLKPEHRTENVEISLGPGDATETDLPIGLIYEMRGSGPWPVRVASHLADGLVLRSNGLEVTA
jgi:hypothetical protein